MTGLCIAAISLTAPAIVSAGQGSVSIGGVHGFTFLDGIIAGAPKSHFATRASWESIFQFGRPNLFGAEFIAVGPVMLQSYVRPTPAVAPAPVIAAAPAGLGSVKLGAGTLTLGNNVTYSGAIMVTQPQIANVSGGVISVGQPNPEAIANIPAPNVISEASPASDVVASAPPPPPNRRPKPPTPPGVPVVSR